MSLFFGKFDEEFDEDDDDEEDLLDDAAVANIRTRLSGLSTMDELTGFSVVGGSSSTADDDNNERPGEWAEVVNFTTADAGHAPSSAACSWRIRQPF